MARSTIPTPEAVIGETRRVGYGRWARTVTQVTIGDSEYAMLADGRLLRFCGRCDDASGKVWAFGSVYAGECFECRHTGLSGKVYDDLDAARKAQRTRMVAAARRQRKAAEEAEAARATFDEWAAANRDLVDALVAADPAPWREDRTLVEQYASEEAWQDFGRTDPFLADMVNQVVNLRRPLTEKQAAATAKALADKAARVAAEAAAAAKQRYAGPVGEQVTVTGTVAVHRYIEPREFGWSGSWLVVVEGTGADEGITVKMFGSGAALRQAERGATVTVSGRVKAHGDYNGVPQTEVGPRPKVVPVG